MFCEGNGREGAGRASKRRRNDGISTQEKRNDGIGHNRSGMMESAHKRMRGIDTDERSGMME